MIDHRFFIGASYTVDHDVIGNADQHRKVMQAVFAKISGNTFVPNGKRSHLNRPCGVANVVSFDDSASNFTCQYPDFRSTVVIILAFDNSGNTSSSVGSL